MTFDQLVGTLSITYAELPQNTTMRGALADKMVIAYNRAYPQEGAMTVIFKEAHVDLDPNTWERGDESQVSVPKSSATSISVGHFHTHPYLPSSPQRSPQSTADVLQLSKWGRISMILSQNVVYVLLSLRDSAPASEKLFENDSKLIQAAMTQAATLLNVDVSPNQAISEHDEARLFSVGSRMVTGHYARSLKYGFYQGAVSDMTGNACADVVLEKM